MFVYGSACTDVRAIHIVRAHIGILSLQNVIVCTDGRALHIVRMRFHFQNASACISFALYVLSMCSMLT